MKIKIRKSIYNTFTPGRVYDAVEDHLGNVSAVNDKGVLEVMLKCEYDVPPEGVTEQVIADLRNREAKGIETYGETLQTFNGRSAPQDLYEEILDAAQYAKQYILEREAMMRYIDRLEQSVRARFGGDADAYLCRWRSEAGMPV